MQIATDVRNIKFVLLCKLSAFSSLQKLDRAMENQQLTAIEFPAHVTAREAAVGRYQLSAISYQVRQRPSSLIPYSPMS